MQTVLLAYLRQSLSTELIEAVETEVAHSLGGEVGFVILVDDLLYQPVLGLAHRALTSFPYQHHEVFQESQLLDVPFLSLDFERVHRDRMLLGIGNVFSAEVFTQSLIRVSSINQHDVGVLLMGLAHHGVNIKALAASRRTENEEVAVVGQLILSLFSRYVNGYWHSLAVGVIDLKWGVLAMHNLFFVHQAGGSVAQSHKSVVVGIHPITVAGE